MRKAREVVAQSSGTIYPSVREAAEKNNCSVGAIYNAIRNGTKVNGTAWSWKSKSVVERSLSHKREMQADAGFSLENVLTKEERKLILPYLIRIRARARRCYREHHGRFGNRSVSETCWWLSDLIRMMSDDRLYAMPEKRDGSYWSYYSFRTWGGLTHRLALVREDMILTGHGESVADAIAVLSYIKKHGDAGARWSAEKSIKELLDTEEQILLIMHGTAVSRRKVNPRFAKGLSAAYGIAVPEEVEAVVSQENLRARVARLEDELRRKSELVEKYKKTLRTVSKLVEESR